MCVCIYIYIERERDRDFSGAAPLRSGDAPEAERPEACRSNNELCHLYPYPCPKKFYKLPAVQFCYTILFYKLAWAWAWV